MSTIGFIVAVGVPAAVVLIGLFIVMAIIDGARWALFVTTIALGVMVAIFALALGGLALGHVIS